MKQILCIFSLLILLTACHPYEEFDDSAEGNFEALWTIMDEHYCFFREKNIDWDGVHEKYRAKIVPGMLQRELFDVCVQMLDTLRDGHVNLSSSFNTSYYRNWWTDYPQDFNIRTLQEHYLKFDYQTTGGIWYKHMDGDIGYMYIPSFSQPIGNTNLDYIFYYFKDCQALIIDIRNNGGGLLTDVETLVERFINEETCGGYMRHKTYSGHDNFSKPYPVTYKPAEHRYGWHDKPIIVITNRSCFSAANDFVSVMKSLSNVTIVGARTGGGSGMPFSAEMPNGWSVRFSACPMTDAQGRNIEEGIDPTPGCEVHSFDSELAQGIDRILDFALQKARKL